MAKPYQGQNISTKNKTKTTIIETLDFSPAMM